MTRLPLLGVKPSQRVCVIHLGKIENIVSADVVRGHVFRVHVFLVQNCRRWKKMILCDCVERKGGSHWSTRNGDQQVINAHCLFLFLIDDDISKLVTIK